MKVSCATRWDNLSRPLTTSRFLSQAYGQCRTRRGGLFRLGFAVLEQFAVERAPIDP
jgi:hypothetical protein